MNGSESLQNDQFAATENALRRAVDTTPALIHTARPDSTWITLTGDGWIFLVSHSKTFVGGAGTLDARRTVRSDYPDSDPQDQELPGRNHGH
jgi:hypothetical protein